MKSKLSQLVKRVRDTQEDEINCSACLDHIAQYVDLELDQRDAAGMLPQVKQHLGQCAICFEEYQVLLDLARLERQGQVPSQQALKDRWRKSS